MKLLVPYVDALRNEDRRLIRIAEFLGVDCVSIAVPRGFGISDLVDTIASERDACLLLNPEVMALAIGPAALTHANLALVCTQFPKVMVHALRADTTCSKLVNTLSDGRLTSVAASCGDSSQYVLADSSRSITEGFTGLSFGPPNLENDHVLCVDGSAAGVTPLISIGRQPFMASLKLRATDILFIASQDVADIDLEVGDAPLTDYFSRLVPHAMALRHMAGDQCWRPNRPQACISIDDPLLQADYGFLNYESLLRMARECNFHASIAFIPHNFKRSSPQITKLFRQYPERLSVCFHGNDHTAGEFATRDESFLNAALDLAECRMLAHTRSSGVPCDKVMVFPQGSFSSTAMKVLKSHNFYAAVNTTRAPAEQPCQLTIAEQAQPAFTRHQGFPVLIRKPIRQIAIQDIAFSFFFGRPVLAVEHHDIFERPECLAEIVAQINAVEPHTRWSNLSTVATNAFLTRRSQDGTYRVRAFVGGLELANDSDHTRQYSIEWPGWCHDTPVLGVLVDGQRSSDFEFVEPGIRINVALPAASASTISLVQPRAKEASRSLGVRWHTKAFVRRRLSEIRDNYISKNRSLLTAAQALHRRLLQL